MKFLKTFLTDEGGQGSVEYIALIALIATAAYLTCNLMGLPIGILIERLTSSISQITGH